MGKTYDYDEVMAHHVAGLLRLLYEEECSICAEMFTCLGNADICAPCSWEMYVSSPDFDDSPPDDERI